MSARLQVGNLARVRFELTGTGGVKVPAGKVVVLSAVGGLGHEDGDFIGREPGYGGGLVGCFHEDQLEKIE